MSEESSEQHPETHDPTAVTREAESYAPPPHDETQGFREPEESGTGEQTELEIWSGRTSWKHFVGRIAFWVAINVAAVSLAIWGTSHWESITFVHGLGAVVAVMLISALVMGWPIAMAIWGCRYRLTSQRLFISRGIVSQTIDQTELVRVDDVRLHKSFLDRISGLGSVSIVSTDATNREIVIPGIAEPEEVAEAIRTHMRALRRKSLFVETL